VIEGIKLVFFRSAQGCVIMIGLMPVWNKIFAYVQTQDVTFCGEAIPYIVLGVQQIPWLIMASIGIACLHTYYRATSQRKYEGLYAQGEIVSAYDRQN
jgi:hypothetical protein